MSWTFDVHAAATSEAREARRWYAARDTAAAAGFVAALDHAIALVREAPLRWPIYLHGTRRLLIRRYPFAVIYRVTGDRILIVAFSHQRRRPGYWVAR